MKWVLVTFFVLISFCAVYSEPKAVLIGEPEVVFSSSGYDYLTLMDGNPRAYVDSVGDTVLWVPPDMRFVGPSLSTVRFFGRESYTEHRDKGQFDARYAEWLYSFYTLDGQRVHAIIHAEWYAYLLGAKTPSECAYNNGWVNALTTAVSTDGGNWFSQSNDDYKIWVSPIPWDVSWPCTPSQRTRYGASGPSNIVHYNGYYYAMFTHWSDPNGYSPETKTCIMRSATLEGGSSWKVWNGEDWVFNQPCKVITQLEANSVNWSNLLQAWVLLGSNKGTDRWWSGVYVQYSQDLLNWSFPEVLFPGLDFPDFVYPALLDDTTGDRNFQIIGSDPYMYWIRFENGGLTRSLMRQKVHFTHEFVVPTPPLPVPKCIPHGHHAC